MSGGDSSGQDDELESVDCRSKHSHVYNYFRIVSGGKKAICKNCKENCEITVRIFQKSSQPNALDIEISLYDRMESPSKRIETLTWWQSNQLQLPLLSRVAFDILSSPMTEVTVERLFSHLKIVIGKHRSSLKGSLINDILFLRMNEKFSNK
jgi:hAT family C-terminal dimerisation region